NEHRFGACAWCEVADPAVLVGNACAGVSRLRGQSGALHRSVATPWHRANWSLLRHSPLHRHRTRGPALRTAGERTVLERRFIDAGRRILEIGRASCRATV